MEKGQLNKFLSVIYSVIKYPAASNINKVEDLDYLIKGYTLAIPDKKILMLLSKFRDFVNKDMESKINYTWLQLIRLYSANDELSIKLFDEMFRRFLDMQNIKYPIETVQ
ncbi:hypothetical protein [Sphingobacterium faecium]|uniref:hypothetical protein n=1 Tax=Sphingobacterium faecium TaxID=34087 RepID=UPI00320B7072